MTPRYQVANLHTNIAGVSTVIPPSATSGSVITAALPPATSPGAEIVLAPGAHTWDVVPALPKGITGKLRIRCAPGAVVTLTTTGSRLFDFNRTADGDVFQRIHISGFTVDAANIHPHGDEHVIIGTKPADSLLQRCSYQDILIEDCYAYNIFADTSHTAYRCGVGMILYHPASGEATQNFIKNFKCRNVKLDGGEQGFLLMGTITGAATTYPGTNQWIDDFVFENCSHNTGLIPTSGGSGVNWQIGGAAVVGRGKLEHCYGYGASDEGIEIDNAVQVDVVDSTIEESWSCNYIATAFNYPVVGSGVTPNSTNYRRAQTRINYTRCVAVSRNLNRTFAFAVNTGASLPVAPDIDLTDCRIEYENPQASDGGTVFGTSGWAIHVTHNNSPLTGGMNHRLTIKNLALNRTGMVSAAAPTAIGIYVAAGTAINQTVVWDGVHWREYGTITSSPPATYLAQLFGGATLHVELDNARVDAQIAGTALANNSLRGILLGSIFGGRTPRTVLSGRVRNVYFGALTGTPQPIGVQLDGNGDGSTTGMLVTAPFLIENVDMRSTGVSAPILVDFANYPYSDVRPFVYFKNMGWPTFPRASAATGISYFTTSTFTSGVGNMYYGNEAAEVHFATGTGAGITAIDTSKDGTTYEQVYAQASGVMASNVLVPIDQGDYVKITFATTAPTTRVRFRRV